MKFSDISMEKWDELKPYLDTCLLPVTGMSGKETPYEATECLEKLRDLMDLVEIPFKGRVVTYPACHYVANDGSFGISLAQWCSSLKEAGFQYVIIASANQSLELKGAGADLVLQPDGDETLLTPEKVSSDIRKLWEASLDE